MSWQDRDYARPEYSQRGWHVSRPGGGGLFGGSIVTTLIVINVLAYMLGRQNTWPWFAMQTNAVLDGHIWRLITSQYLHAGLAHIMFNMLALYFLGPALEREWGKRRFLAVYTISGICGNLFLMVLGQIGWSDPTIPAVGASGCILGLLGAAAVLFPHAEVLIYFVLPVRIRDMVVIYAIYYTYNIITKGSNYGGDACHLAGLAFGLWYAKFGHHWWNARALRRGSSGRSGTGWVGRTLSGIGAPSAGSGGGKSSWQAQQAQRVADAQLIDQLLVKVREGGLHSLTTKERKQLTDASERERARDAQMGRVDRV